MVLAHGMQGAGMGFGFGFLNLVGNLLFLFLIFWLIKNLVFSWRNGDFGGGSWGPGLGGSGGPGGPGSNRKQRKEAWKARQQESANAAPQADDALAVARQRVAEGEIQPEEFEVIKQGLSNDHVNQDGWSARAHDSALDTARMRFAKGEISLEEFEAVKKTLMGA